jgi:hypothetical protein
VSLFTSLAEMEGVIRLRLWDLRGAAESLEEALRHASTSNSFVAWRSCTTYLCLSLSLCVCVCVCVLGHHLRLPFWSVFENVHACMGMIAECRFAELILCLLLAGEHVEGKGDIRAGQENLRSRGSSRQSIFFSSPSVMHRCSSCSLPHMYRH